MKVKYMKIYVTPNSPEGFPCMGLEVCVKVEKRRHIVLEGRGVMGLPGGLPLQVI